jgi:hypothetical protein
MSEPLIPKYLADVIDWYERAATRNRYGYLAIKMVQLFLAAAIPVVSLTLSSTPESHQGLINGSLAAALLIAEGIQQTLQLQAQWTEYRSTHNALRREILLYESLAGDYKVSASPTTLFSERAVAIIAADHSAWTALQDSAKDQKTA